jgi:hypothetical protein
LIAQAAAVTWSFTVNAAMVGDLLARGHRDPLPAIMAISIVTQGAALVLFLLIRWLMARVGRGQRRALADLGEIGAYLLAQTIGFFLTIFVMTSVVGSLYRSGVRDLAVASLACSIVTILVVMLIFLFLRRVLTANGRQASRGGAAGFGFGLAFAAWVIVALTIGSDRGLFATTSVTERLPWLFDVCVAASLAAWAGGSAAYALTRVLQSRSWRAAMLTIVVPCITLPAAAVLAMAMSYAACAGQVEMGWVIRTGAENTAKAVTAGGFAFGVPCFLAVLLWSLYWLRPPR